MKSKFHKGLKATYWETVAFFFVHSYPGNKDILQKLGPYHIGEHRNLAQESKKLKEDPREGGIPAGPASASPPR